MHVRYFICVSQLPQVVFKAFPGLVRHCCEMFRTCRAIDLACLLSVFGLNGGCAKFVLRLRSGAERPRARGREGGDVCWKS